MTPIYISINRQVIAKNTHLGLNEPPVRVARGKHGKPVYCHGVDIQGPSMLLYSPRKPLLKCGARLAIKTEHPVYCLDANRRWAQLIEP